MIGLSNPLYQVGADAMLADMIPAEKRTDAYAINRIANNAAFALGPAIGGFLATRSYDLAFYGAGIGFLAYSLLLFFLARETLNTEDIPKDSVKAIAAPVRPFDKLRAAPSARSITPSWFASSLAIIGWGRAAWPTAPTRRTA